MLKRVNAIKRDLQNMVTSEKWPYFGEGDAQKTEFAKERVLDDLWWNNVDYMLAFYQTNLKDVEAYRHRQAVSSLSL